MYRIFAIFSVILAIFVVNGCARVSLEYANNEIEFAGAAGHTSPERGLEILERQAYASRIISEQKIYTTANSLLQTAIASGNRDSVRKAKDLIREISPSYEFSPNDQVRWLGVRNLSSQYIIEIESEPFSGLILNPGEKSFEKKPIPVGIYRIKYRYYRVGSSSYGTNTINVSIGRYRSEDIVFAFWK